MKYSMKLGHVLMDEKRILMSACIFCKIISHQIPTPSIYETDLTLVIRDIHPRAPIHYLVITKKHIEHMGLVEKQDAVIMSDMAMVIQHLSATLAKPVSFNVISNNGSGAGQSVPHLHWHFLAGKNLYTTEFKL